MSACSLDRTCGPLSRACVGVCVKALSPRKNSCRGGPPALVWGTTRIASVDCFPNLRGERLRYWRLHRVSFCVKHEHLALFVQSVVLGPDYAFHQCCYVRHHLLPFVFRPIFGSGSEGLQLRHLGCRLHHFLTLLSFAELFPRCGTKCIHIQRPIRRKDAVFYGSFTIGNKRVLIANGSVS